MSFSTGCRKCKKCGKMYRMSLFDGGLCAECEKAEQEPIELDFKRPKKIVGKLISVEVLDKIKAEIDEQIKYNTYFNSDMAKGEIIAFEWVKRKIDEYRKEQE